MPYRILSDQVYTLNPANGAHFMLLSRSNMTFDVGVLFGRRGDRLHVLREV